MDTLELYETDIFLTQASWGLDGHGKAFHLGLQAGGDFGNDLC